MEDSRKGRRNGEKGQETPSPHVDGEKGKESIVYKRTEEGKRTEKYSKNEHWGMSDDTFCAGTDT